MFSQDEEWDGKVTSCHKLSDHDEFELIALGLAIDADAHQQQHVGVQELAVNLSKGSKVSVVLATPLKHCTRKQYLITAHSFLKSSRIELISSASYLGVLRRRRK
jgi:hypothetical protein